MPRPAGAMRTCLLFFLMTAPLTLAMDRQLDDCTPSKPCKKNYRGTCRNDVDGCDEDEWDLGRVGCEDDCHCCGCGNDAMKYDCEDAGGSCVPDGGSCCGIVQPKWCRGKKCFCCIPECPVTETCTDQGGYCADHCIDGETGHPELCTNDNCLCCVEELEECPVTETCTDQGGHCADHCIDGETGHPELCTNDNCLCCVEELEGCDDTPECSLDFGGRCSSACGQDPLRNGVIEDRCGITLPPGAACRCCTDCPPTTHECETVYGGYCAKKCPPWMDNEPDVCDTEDCVCCYDRY